MRLLPYAAAKPYWDSSRWHNFNLQEFACKCCGEVCFDAPDFDRAQAFRTALGRPVVFNSVHRCTKHNQSVGGAVNSQHLENAWDFSLRKGRKITIPELEKLQEIARSAGWFSVGLYRTFWHLDKRTDNRFWIKGKGTKWTQYARRFTND